MLAPWRSHHEPSQATIHKGEAKEATSIGISKIKGDTTSKSPSPTNEITTAVIGLIGVIIGSLIAIAGQWATEKQKKNRELAYAAVVIGYAAERAYLESLNIVEDFELFQLYDNEEHQHFPHDTPVIALSELGIDWKVISIRFLDKLFECRARLTGNARIYDTTMGKNMDCVRFDAYKIMDLIEICDGLLAVAVDLRKAARMPIAGTLLEQGESKEHYVARLEKYVR